MYIYLSKVCLIWFAMVFLCIIANEYQGGYAADKKQFVGKESHIFLWVITQTVKVLQDE